MEEQLYTIKGWSTKGTKEFWTKKLNDMYFEYCCEDPWQPKESMDEFYKSHKLIKA